jgi:hypothetical protein
MNTKLLLECANFLALLMCATILLLMWRRRALRDFALLAAFLSVEALHLGVNVAILFFRKRLGIPGAEAYSILFVSYWIYFVAESVILISIIYSVFRLAMRPLVGLHRIGKVVFRWVAGVSLLLSLAFAIGPHLFLSGTPASTQYMNLSGQLQQGISVLTLCLLLFVCFSVKPLGLTFRSHIFGVSLGLGVFATTQLVEAAWLATTQATSVYSPVYLFGTVGGCLAYGVWAAYFAMPEPKRGMVLLPTTSPYFLWNRISEALGDNPGHVAVAGFKPEMLHPTELMVLTAQSKAAKQATEDSVWGLAAEAAATESGAMASITSGSGQAVVEPSLQTAAMR